MSEHKSDVFDAVTVSSTHKVEKGGGLQRTFSVLLFAVFVVMDLLALVAGAHSFGSLIAMRSQNDQLIMTLGPITSTVRANDTSGGMETGKGPEGPSLVMVQSDAYGSYETRIYLYEGHIVQEYTLGGSPYTPQTATVLAESESFAFSYDKGLLTITTDAGEATIALRNLQEGA